MPEESLTPRPPADPGSPQDDLLTIGQLADLVGAPVTTLRYYEKRGLLEPPVRVAGQRRYGPAAVMRIMVIRFCKVAGLSLEEIRMVLADQSPGRTQTKELAAAHLDRIDDQIDRLRLARVLLSATLRCICPSVESCRCGAMDPAVAELGTRLGPDDAW